MSKFVPVAKKSEIPDQAAKCVQVKGRSIALFNLGGQFYAIDDTFSHVGGPLSGGLIQGEEKSNAPGMVPTSTSNRARSPSTRPRKTSPHTTFI